MSRETHGYFNQISAIIKHNTASTTDQIRSVHELTLRVKYAQQGYVPAKVVSARQNVAIGVGQLANRKPTLIPAMPQVAP